MDAVELQISGLLDHEGRPAGRLKQLAESDILAGVAAAVKTAGLAGETYSIKLLYLGMTSRLLDRPIHIVIKAPSASGKSYLINTVCKLFDEDAYYALTSASPKVLFRPNLNLKHRVLVIQEAIWSRDLDYVLRTLLSEGKLEYPTVIGGEAVILRNAGPVAFVTSTTKWELDPELETRLYTVPLSTKPEQTRAILIATAEGGHAPLEDSEATTLLRQWQGWLQEYSSHTAEIPFAGRLAELVPTDNIRVRRDFAQLLALIRTHALLYQATRKVAETGTPIATIADYAAVFDLLCGVRGQDSKAAVVWQADMLSAVKVLGGKNGSNGECSLNGLASELGWALSTTHRRTQALIKAGHIGQRGSGQGDTARLYIRAELGADWLPSPKALVRKAVKV